MSKQGWRKHDQEEASAIARWKDFQMGVDALTEELKTKKVGEGFSSDPEIDDE